MFRWDPTINAGTIIALAVMLLALLRVTATLAEINVKVQAMWAAFDLGPRRRVTDPLDTDYRGRRTPHRGEAGRE